MLSQMSHQIIILIKSVLRSVIVRRIPIRTLQRLSNKSRKIREFFYINVCVRAHHRLQKCIDFLRLENIYLSLNPLRHFVKLSRAKQYCSLFSCNRVMCLYKSETHVMNYCKLKLSTDIEKNPGPLPMYVDPSKTIAAPYSQGNELVFGQNKGQQCVAMSLCSLIYNNKQGISSVNDLIQIMNIGNQL